MGTAAFGHGRVRQVVRGKLSVGVEDVTQQVLLWSSCDSGEVGADVVSEAPDGMTGNAVLLEERCALFRIARACEGAPNTDPGEPFYPSHIKPRRLSPTPSALLPTWTTGTDNQMHPVKAHHVSIQD